MNCLKPQFWYDLRLNTYLRVDAKILNKQMNPSKLDSFFQQHQNFTFIDTPDNSMHVPFFEEPTSKKKVRKSPKRTVQKIIKKSRSKRKFFLNMLTSTAVPSIEPPRFEADFTRVNAVPLETTQQTTLKKKPRYSGRLARYPANYQRPSHVSYKQHIDNFKRTKREDVRDAYILQDFDEVKFLPKENGYDTAVVHVKKYW